MSEEAKTNIVASPSRPLHISKTVSKVMFCAACQAEVAHTLGLDKNNEILCVCSCGRHIKFPLSTDPTELEKHINNHKEANVGQVTVEMAENKQKEHDERFRKMMGISE